MQRLQQNDEDVRKCTLFDRPFRSKTRLYARSRASARVYTRSYTEQMTSHKLINVQSNDVSAVRTQHLATPQSAAASVPERNVQTQYHELPTDNQTTWTLRSWTT